VAMALEPGQLFNLMEVAYRKGVIDKFMPLQGEALKRLKEKTGFGMPEISNLMNDAKEETVKRIDFVLKHAGPLLCLAANEALMGLASRMLDLEVIKRIIVWTNFKLLEWMIAKIQGTLPPLRERLRSIPKNLGGKIPGTAGKAPRGVG
jgi:hypothetical protein